MSNKPSLYVVERKEVVILVILFVLVTVMAFTLGVKYGETLGRRASLEANEAKSKIHEELAGGGGEGTLGHEGAKADSHDEHGAPVGDKSENNSHGESGPENKDAHGEAHGSDAHGSGAHGADAHGSEANAKPADAHGEAPKPEDAAKESAGSVKGKLQEKPKEPVDTNSDQHLLNALKDAGIQAPKSGKAEKASESVPTQLPEDTKVTKSLRAGAYTIQVGSYPSRSDAEYQLKRLKGLRLEASMLHPVSEKSGEWYRVVVGSYNSKQEADSAAKQLQAKGHIKSYFVRKNN